MKINLTMVRYLFILSLTFICGCNLRPDPEALPLSVNATLNLLQEDPQFVMYMNFKSMSRTEFWKKNVSDSLLNAEKTFGSLLNTFKMATGASVSEGLDEFYYSNSWFGENAIVLKGIFDRNKLNNFLATDSIFSITKNSNGVNIYIKNDNGLYFFFKDDFTICSSNYLKQIDVMLAAKDTSQTGLLTNVKVFDAIQNIIYKQDLWMVSTEKVFIRGIFQNLIESTSGIRLSENDSLSDSLSQNKSDSISINEKLSMENFYKRLNSISFSAQMKKDLKFLVQCESVDAESAKYLASILNGLITVAKLSSSGKQKAPGIVDKLKLNRYDNDIFIELQVDESNLHELRKTNLINEPGSF
ncbi:MAG: hypothetical protein ABI462_13310 [Ignavibacteria bacterium]